MLICCFYLQEGFFYTNLMLFQILVDMSLLEGFFCTSLELSRISIEMSLGLRPKE